MITVNDKLVIQGSFPDHSLHMKLVHTDDSVYIKWNYENDSELFSLICIRKFYQDNECHLFMPYMPHARMDRVEDNETVFTLKYFCEIINDLKFYEVVVADVHSKVTLELLDNCSNLEPVPYIRTALDMAQASFHDMNLVAFFPDKGARDRYKDMVGNLNDIAFGTKVRDWQTGQILGLEVTGDVKDKNILIIDDISSRGGTFYHSAKKLKELGAKNISLYITHCENTILKGEIFKSGLIKDVYTTHSLSHEPALMDKVTYVD